MLLEFTETYKKAITDRKMEEHIKEHGKEIHRSGTEELIVYFDAENDDLLQLRLDVLDDLKTPNFHVRGSSDNEYLEIFDTYKEAEDDFFRVLKNKKVTVK